MTAPLAFCLGMEHEGTVSDWSHLRVFCSVAEYSNVGQEQSLNVLTMHATME